MVDPKGLRTFYQIRLGLENLALVIIIVPIYLALPDCARGETLIWQTKFADNPVITVTYYHYNFN